MLMAVDYGCTVSYHTGRLLGRIHSGSDRVPLDTQQSHSHKYLLVHYMDTSKEFSALWRGTEKTSWSMHEIQRQKYSLLTTNSILLVMSWNTAAYPSCACCVPVCTLITNPTWLIQVDLLLCGWEQRSKYHLGATFISLGNAYAHHSDYSAGKSYPHKCTSLRCT